MPNTSVLMAVVQDIKAHWCLGLVGAVGGAVLFILLGETVRWWMGKGFFQ